MDEKVKAETDAVWNGLKQALEPLVTAITAFYQAMGSTRSCRHINELWHPENAGVGLGFVPPEARDQLEAAIILQGLHLHKSNGPLGKSAYFSLLYDGQLTVERVQRLSAAVEKESQNLRNTCKGGAKPLAAEAIIETEMARIDGMPVARAEKLKSRPADVADLVDRFNAMARTMTDTQAVDLLANSIPYFNLPQDAINELQRVLDLLRATVPKA